MSGGRENGNPGRKMSLLTTLEEEKNKYFYYRSEWFMLLGKKIGRGKTKRKTLMPT